MEKSLQALLDGLIDYAGLFPPASEDMRTAVAKYAAYRRGPEAPWLGRFVLPAARLEEFREAAAAESASDSVATGAGSSGAGGASRAAEHPAAPWRLSVLIGASLAADLARIESFEREAAARDSRAALPGFGSRGVPATGSGARIDALEMKAARPGDIAAAMGSIPAGITPYFEFPPDADPAPFLDVLAATGGRAKLRTGGVTPDLIPDVAAVAGFLEACARAKVPFKATAGLHHPLRSLRRLTYAPDSPVAVMHGFLNVFLAAALAAEGAEAGELAALLGEKDAGAFRFGADGVAWRQRRISRARLEAVRREFAVGFGSCSFEEPRQDLEEAKLL